MNENTNDINSPMQQMYQMMKNGNIPTGNNQGQGNQQQMPMGGPQFPMNPQQNQWGNQPNGEQMNNQFNQNQNMPMNNQQIFINQGNLGMNPNMFWGNNFNNQMQPNMMMNNPSMFYPFNTAFMNQQAQMPNQFNMNNMNNMNQMFQNQWQFQQNQGNSNAQQPQQPQNNANSQNWTLIFENKEINQRINVQITDDQSVDEAMNRYRKKSLDTSPLQFKFHGKPLNNFLKLSQSGLHDNAIISVEKMGPNSNPQNPGLQPPTQYNFSGNAGQQMNNFAQNQFFHPGDGNYNLVFEQKGGGQSITIQISPDKLVLDAINSFKNKMLYQGEMKFIFNGQNLEPNITIQKAGLRNGSKILVITTKDIEGA